jgi:DegV family protein with EDD domain
MTDKVAIATDSVASLPEELVKKYGIEVVPVEVIFGEKSYRDGIDITPSQFYKMLREAEKLPTTVASLPGPALETYQKAARKASNILFITLSEKFSGMYNSALLAKDMAKEALPGVTIEVIDSRTAAGAQGLVVLAAARAASAGKSLEEVIEITESVIKKVSLFAILDTLYYLHKGGRVPKIAALATTMLKIKPILSVYDGEAHPVTNPRTDNGAMKRILEMMEEKVVKGQPLHVAVMHADALDRAITLKDEVSSRFDCTELIITEFTPVMGAHTGPGVVGVAFYCGD